MKENNDNFVLMIRGKLLKIKILIEGKQNFGEKVLKTNSIRAVNFTLQTD